MMFLNLFLPILALAISADLRLPEAGRFTYRGEFEILQKRIVEGVHIDTQGGRARVEELLKQGYTCTSAGSNFARCVGFVSVEGAEREVKDRVDALLRGVALTFAARMGEPSLTYKGETYQDWSVPQAGSFLGKEFSAYRYQVLRDGPHKLYFGETGVLVDESGFSYVANLQKQVKRYVMASYLIRAKLR